MRKNSPNTGFIIDRDRGDRRISTQSDLPYLTEEGLVLIDRRTASERRNAQWPSVERGTPIQASHPAYVFDTSSA